jgi:hypothetical protein
MLRASSEQADQRRRQQHHIWEAADRDPTYDYDHARAHGSESIARMRTLSLGNLVGLSQFRLISNIMNDRI